MTQSAALYQHTQPGTLVTWALGAGAALVAVVVAIAGLEHPAALAAGAVPLGILLVALVLFRSLTVRVGADNLTVWFGGGLIRRTFHTRDLRDAHIVRNPWYYGWGIRYTPHGWLWNVSGHDAVELSLSSGRRFRIGTDDPAGLLAAVRRAGGLDG